MDGRTTSEARAAMYSRNRLKLGLFGANCSSGRAVTMVPERWSGSWTDCLKLARMADAAGIEFMLPIGRCGFLLAQGRQETTRRKSRRAA